MHLHHIHNGSRATIPAPQLKPLDLSKLLVRRNAERSIVRKLEEDARKTLDLRFVVSQAFPCSPSEPLSEANTPEELPVVVPASQDSRNVVAHAGRRLHLYPRQDRHNDASWERELADA